MFVLCSLQLNSGGNVRESLRTPGCCMIKSVCKERFYYNFSHFSHFRDGFSFSSLSRLSTLCHDCGLKGILSATRHHFHEDVQKLNIFSYTLNSRFFLFASSPYTFSTEKRKTYKKGTYSTSILLCLCL